MFSFVIELEDSTCPINRELEDKGMTCYGQSGRLTGKLPHHLCGKRGKLGCGRVITKFAHACRCDEQCTWFGDCCPDFWTNCPKQAALTKSQALLPKRSAAKCLPAIVSYYKPTNTSIIKIMVRNVRVIGSCPTNFADHTIKQKCEKETTRLTTEEIIFVTDTKTNVTFPNVFCALCNGISLSNLLSWDLRVVCDVGSKQLIQTWKSDRNLLEDLIADGCRLLNAKQLYTTAGREWRECNPEEIASCSNTSACSHLPLIKHQCEEPLYFPSKVIIKGVKKPTQVFYKNQFCALCNNFPLEPSENVTHQFSMCTLSLTSDSHVTNAVSLSHFSLKLTINFMNPDCFVVQGKSNNVSEKSICISQFQSMINPLASGICTSESFLCSAIPTRLDQSPKWLGILSLASMSLSEVALIVHISLQPTIPNKHLLLSKLLLCLSVCLLVWTTLYIAGPFYTQTVRVCFIFAVLSHWSLLSAFFCMNIIAYDLWRVFAQPLPRINRNRNNLAKYLAYIFFPSGLVVGSAVAVDLLLTESAIRPCYGQPVCWLSCPKGLFVFFAVPLAFIIASNLAMYALTVAAIRKVNLQVSRGLNLACEYRYLSVYMRQFCLMGFTWILGFVASFTERDEVWAAFAMTSGLQGVMILTHTLTGSLMMHKMANACGRCSSTRCLGSIWAKCYNRPTDKEVSTANSPSSINFKRNNGKLEYQANVETHM